MQKELGAELKTIKLRVMQPRPIINLDEEIGKVVGRRLPPRDTLSLNHSNRKQAAEWMAALPVRLPPRGVYRFRSHEEASQWMTRNTGAIKA